MMAFFTVQRKRIHDGFFSKVAQRRREFGKTRQISGRVCVPPELQWWYWQEFGTATRGDAGRASGQTYEIIPINWAILKFPWHGEVFYRDIIKAHPGIPSHHSVTKRLPAIRDIAIINLELSAIRDGFFSVDGIYDSLLVKTLPQAIEIISSQMSQDLPGIREDGRLGGDTAANDFLIKAYVKDTTA